MKAIKLNEKDQAWAEFMSLADALRKYLIRMVEIETHKKGIKNPSLEGINGVLFHLYKSYGKNWNNVINYIANEMP